MEKTYVPLFSEILDKVHKAKTKDKKVAILREHKTDSLKMLLKAAFDPKIEWVFPEGEVPYGDIGDQSVYSGTLSENIAKEMAGGESATGQDMDGRGKTSLRREWKNLYHYVKGGNDSLTSVRREMMFINLLRGLHPKEAELLCLVKDKALTTKYKITIDNVKKAYPDITWGGRS